MTSRRHRLIWLITSSSEITRLTRDEVLRCCSANIPLKNTIEMLLALAPLALDPSTPIVWLLTDNYMEVQDRIMRVQTWTQTSWVNIYTKHDLRSHCITSCLIEDRWHYTPPRRFCRRYTNWLQCLRFQSTEEQSANISVAARGQDSLVNFVIMTLLYPSLCCIYNISRKLHC